MKQKSYYSTASILLVAVFLVTIFQTNILRAQFAYVPNSNSGNVSIIDVSTLSVVGNVTVGFNPIGVAVKPDGSEVYIANFSSNSVSVINTASKLVTATIPVPNSPLGMAFNPDGSRLYVANFAGNTVTMINTVKQTIDATIPVGTNPVGVLVSSDGSTLYVANGGSNNVSIVSTATNTVIKTLLVGMGPTGLAIRPDGKRVYVTNIYSGTVSVINTASQTVTFTIHVGASPNGLAVNKTGTELFVANSNSNTVSVINTGTNNVVSTVSVAPSVEPSGVAVSADGTKVFISNASTNNVVVMDAVTHAITSSISVGTRPISFGNFTGANFSTFPVELTAFEAAEDRGQIILNWTTASELNNAEFVIQRSADGQVFETLGTVSGSGTTLEPQAYEFRDLQPLSVMNYYRLKQIDFDGQFQYSSIIRATINNDLTPQLVLVPNPAYDQVRIDWGKTYKETSVSVWDAVGKLHMRTHLYEKNSSTLDVSKLLPGFYTIMIKSGPETAVQRLLVKP